MKKPPSTDTTAKGLIGINKKSAIIAVIWWAKRDLNPYGIATTRF